MSEQAFSNLINQVGQFISELDQRIEDAEAVVIKLREERNQYRLRLTGLISMPIPEVTKSNCRGRNGLPPEVREQLRTADGTLRQIASRFGISMTTAHRYRTPR